MNRSSRVLAVGAHPDDIEVGCAGLLQRYKNTKIVVLSRGEAGGNPLDRTNEANAAANLLDSDLLMGHLPDTKIAKHEAIKIIENQIKRFKPDLVLTMAKKDTHQDHQVTFEATIIATRNIPCTVLSYIGPSSAQFFNPTWFAPLTNEGMERKLEAIACHKTQANRDYLHKEHLINVAKYWAEVTRSGYKFVEPYELIKHWEKI